MAEQRCLVAICHNVETVTRKTAQSLMELGWGNRVEEAKRKRGFVEIAFAWFTQLPRVDALRNVACDQARRDSFTHLLFLDADMVWPSDVLERMLAHANVGIVSALYFLKHPPHTPVAFRHREIQDPATGYSIYTSDDDVFDAGADGLRDEQLVGMGCTVFATALLERLGEKPWFHYQDDPNGWPRVSEDVPFCQKAQAAGIRIAVDPSVRCGHVAPHMVDANYFRRVQQVHAAEAKRHTVIAEVTRVPRPQGAPCEVGVEP